MIIGVKEHEFLNVKYLWISLNAILICENEYEWQVTILVIIDLKE